MTQTNMTTCQAAKTAAYQVTDKKSWKKLCKFDKDAVKLGNRYLALKDSIEQNSSLSDNSLKRMKCKKLELKEEISQRISEFEKDPLTYEENYLRSAAEKKKKKIAA